MSIIIRSMPVVVLAVCIQLSLCVKAMEQIDLPQDPLDSHTWVGITGKYPSIMLKRFETKAIQQEEKEFLMNLAGNFTDLQEIFGFTNASIIKAIHTVSPETIMKMKQQQETNKLADMPKGKKHFYNWIIKDLSADKYAGYVSLATYTDDIPQKYKNKLPLEVGVVLHSSYRRQGLATHYAPLILTWLQQSPSFDNALFCFDTLPTQKAVHGLAKKLQWECAASRSRLINFGLYESDIVCDLFVIPKIEPTL
jgi:RimJ/RimL family protein N-acetyltransferase